MHEQTDAEQVQNVSLEACKSFCEMKVSPLTGMNGGVKRLATVPTVPLESDAITMPIKYTCLAPA